jgi:hypothetical protein
MLHPPRDASSTKSPPIPPFHCTCSPPPLPAQARTALTAVADCGCRPRMERQVCLSLTLPPHVCLPLTPPVCAVQTPVASPPAYEAGPPAGWRSGSSSCWAVLWQPRYGICQNMHACHTCHTISIPPFAPPVCMHPQSPLCVRQWRQWRREGERG